MYKRQGGGMVGAETAEFLAEKGHDVSIIEMRDAIGPDVIHEHRVFLMEGLKEYDVHQYVNAAVSEIYPDGVSYKNAADKSDETVYELRGFDTVVLDVYKRQLSDKKNLTNQEFFISAVGRMSDVEYFLSYKDEILKNIKERKIYNYVYPQIISVEITVNPENKNLMNI